MKLKNIHPHTKLISAFTVIVLSFLLDYRFTFLLVIPIIGIIHSSQYSFKAWLISWGFALPYLIMLLLITGFTFQSSQTAWISYESLKINQEVVLHVFGRSKSMITMIFVIPLIVIHTRKEDMLAAYQTPSWMASSAFLMTSIIVNLQVSHKQAKAIMIAQQTRGVTTKGGLVNRIKSIWPLMMPLVIHSMLMNQQRHLTYIVRGYDIHQPQTLLHQCIKTRYEKTFEITILILTGLIILFKVLL
jgi:energy-coupling factor transporter transmembrane protein EcfT